MSSNILLPYWDFVKLVYAAAIDNPLLFGLQVFALICLTTRRWTAFQKSYRADDPSSGTQAIPRASYWIPIVANTILFSIRSQSWLLDQARRYRSSVFSLRIYGRDHVIVTSPELCHALAKSDAVSDVEFRVTRSRRFFADRNASPSTVKLVNRAVADYRADEKRLSKLAKILEGNGYNLISPSASWVDQAQWERTSDVKVVSDDPALTVSANVTVLVRDFVSHMLLSVLLGGSFVEANSSFVADFFYFSSKYNTFMTGMPYWLGPGLGPPALARERCLLALDGLVNAVLAEVDSDVGVGASMLHDTDDVYASVTDMIKAARKEDKHVPVRSISCQILEVIFEVSFYTVNLVVWVVVYLFKDGQEYTATLVAVRDEIKKLVQVEQPQPSGLSFQESPKLAFKLRALRGNNVRNLCPTLAATTSEVRRLETEFEKYLVMEQDYLLYSQDLKASASTTKERYQLLRGDYIYAAEGAANKDQQRWDRPRRFVPGRFLSSKRKGDGSEDHVDIFFEKEVALLVAALLCFYSFTDNGGIGFSHPSSNLDAGIRTTTGNTHGQVSRLLS